MPDLRGRHDGYVASPDERAKLSRSQQARCWIERQYKNEGSELARTARQLAVGSTVNPFTALLETVQSLAAWKLVIESQLTDDDVRDVTPTYLAFERVVERLGKFCKYAIDAGIAERTVQLAELQGTVLYRAITHALDAATAQSRLSPEQLAAFKAAFAPALRAGFEAERVPRPPEAALEAHAAVHPPRQGVHQGARPGAYPDSQLPQYGATP